ncbi:hypothetical protein BDY19DRAFT_1053876 [Irpex rosettiformis]|uniref:Uncharacterized protein n=1 Tax=Irpex rosettiformis TaxID=378272 RepID=A0ACB8UGG0_9APHY|nr:hypothetical protein BDY19DRAFT_1053876 [Irpex rosettiformis]
MKIEHIECQIICDDEALAEYQEKSDSEDQKAKNCYIVSDVGKRFMLQLRSHPHKSDIACHLSIDGQQVSNLCLEDDRAHDFRGIRTGESQLRPFIFSPIITTDDDRLRESISTSQDLGTICMKMYRLTDKRPSLTSYDSTLNAQDKLEDRPIHERAKKAGGHRVTLGQPETKQWGGFVNVNYVDPMNSPYYTFTWRYRSKAMLQAQGIVPQDHPVASSSKRPASSTSSDNSSKRPRTERSASQESSNRQFKTENMQSAREFQARRDALKAQRAAIEAQEVALEEELPQAKAESIKREASPIILGAGNGDVIDLTEDD